MKVLIANEKKLSVVVIPGQELLGVYHKFSDHLSINAFMYSYIIVQKNIRSCVAFPEEEGRKLRKKKD